MQIKKGDFFLIIFYNFPKTAVERSFAIFFLGDGFILLWINFLQLQDELSDVENKIAAARRFYNNAVQEYNTGREQFPANLIAGSFNFEEREFFEALEGREALETPVQVDFS